MVTVLIHFFLFSFWLSKCAGFDLEKLLGLGDGFSLPNLCLYFFIVIWFYTLKARDTFFQQNNVNRYLFILIIMIAVSVFLNIVGYGVKKTNLFEEIIIYKGLITPWLLFFLITTLIQDKRTCERSISGLILFLVATVFLVLIENYLGVQFGTRRSGQSYVGRSAGFSEANQYAAFLVLFLPLFFTSTFLQKEMSKRIKGCFFLLLGVIGLASAISKGGFIAFFCSIGYFLSITNRESMIDVRKAFLYLFLLFTLGATSYFLLPSQSKEIAKNRVTLQQPKPSNPWHREFLRKQSWADKLTSGRTKLWRRSLEFISQRPILGYGNGACKNQLRLSTHSDPLKWLVNHGVIGFLLFSKVFIQVFRHVIFHFRISTNQQSRLLYLSYICGFVGYVVAMFGVNIYEPRIIFWIYTAIIYKHTQLDTVREK
jgi:O-antigen ligase